MIAHITIKYPFMISNGRVDVGTIKYDTDIYRVYW